jgi:hypothetical protein
MILVLGGVFAVISIKQLLIWRDCKRMDRAFKIIDLSADLIVNDTKRLLLVPFIQFVLTVITLALWVGSYAMISTLDKITPDDNIS